MEMLFEARDNLIFMKHIITDDECDMKTEQQASERIVSGEPKSKRTRHYKSQIRKRLTVFF